MDDKSTKKFTSRAVTGALTLVAFILILCSSDVAIEYMKKGLGLCAATVIPSLFPFMIISELIVSSGIGIRISKIFSKPMRKLFGVSEGGAAVYFLGTVCGFPIGAKTAASMYDRGMISKREFERLLTFCNNPGSAFVISATGVALLGDERLGILLYACVILSSMIVGVGSKLFFKKEEKRSAYILPTGDCNTIKSITNAIQGSALSMLSVCAYVVFFSAFVGCIGAFLSRFSPSDELVASIFGFFELSSGVGTASTVDNRLGAILLCALFLGWSGLSVHFQVMSVCAGRDLSFKPYMIAKATQGILCAIIAGVSVKFIFPSMLSKDSAVYISANQASMMLGSLICLAFFLAAVTCIFVVFLCTRKFFKNKNEKIKKRY